VIGKSLVIYLHKPVADVGQGVADAS
jgi:hypothetical protein